ncbi:uncharacterized protein [Blastocystis hominis]|uniref:Uncharacterized protein n=1 Tax=Blastocystis hominis TaxID=12968 RepID=D8LYF3_BLAHO|nr:uncharacterized protein [Blastocystis hominis]CBK20608.2 unnamed protein product [Blastocystis hominis]|eukprot:XP_012894656.1 uncharacterized protein [Blastocystis hominis]
MSLWPMICDGDTEVDSRCWHHGTILTPEAPHPAHGSFTDLKALVEAIHSRGMRVLFDVDWTGFSNASVFYDYDQSGHPSSYGPLFEPGEEYRYNAHLSQKPRLTEDQAMFSLFASTLDAFTGPLGFDGVYWKGLLCLRLDGARCAHGQGSENAALAAMLRSVVGHFPAVRLWFGEDDDNLHATTRHSIQNIVDAVGQGGLGFHAKRDLAGFPVFPVSHA